MSYLMVSFFLSLISAFESNRASFVNITTEKREAYQDRHCSKQLPSSRDLKRATYLCSLAAHPQDFDICFHGPASSYPTSKSFTGLVLGHPRGISNASTYLFDFTRSYRELPGEQNLCMLWFISCPYFFSRSKSNWRRLNAIPDFNVPSCAVSRFFHHRGLVYTPHHPDCGRCLTAHTR
jgi:hypothetical protein